MKGQALLKFVLPDITKRTICGIGNTQQIFKEKLFPDLPDKHKFLQTNTRSCSQRIGGLVKDITVDINISNKLKTPCFDKKLVANLKTGQSLYNAIDNLRQSNPTFSFTAHLNDIREMCGRPASFEDQTYWQISKIVNDVPKPLDKGPGVIKPENDDQFMFSLTQK